MYIIYKQWLFYRTSRACNRRRSWNCCSKRVKR